MTRPAPMLRPLTVRAVGVGLDPRNAVRSAEAVAGINSRTTRQKGTRIKGQGTRGKGQGKRDENRRRMRQDSVFASARFLPTLPFPLSLFPCPLLYSCA